MYNSLTVHEKVMREYERRRALHKKQLTEYNENLYNEIPEIKEIDEQISFLAIKHASLVASEKLTPEEAVTEVEKEKKILLDKRKNAIANVGFSVELPSLYDCEKCKDTGYVNNEKCSCYMDIMKKVMLSDINGSKNISFDFDKDTFDNFNLEWYSKSVDTKTNTSAYDNMRSVLNVCRLFCFDFRDKGGNLYFYGKSGTGKSFMANCIANSLIKQGFSVVYQSAYKLFQFMEDYKFGRTNRENTSAEYDAVYNSDLLIIDDLGTEFSTAYTCSVLFDILNTRILNGKSTIISTNLSIGNIGEKYTERVSSRIIGNFDMFRFMGDDIRIAKKFNRR